MATDLFARAIVYVVDDEAVLRHMVDRMLSSAGLTVSMHMSAEEFVNAFQADDDRPRCLVLDFQLPGMTGLELLKWLRTEGVQIPVIMLTAHGEMQLAVQAFHAGAVDFLEKPISRSNLLKSVEEALVRDASGRPTRSRVEIFLANRKPLSSRERDVFDLMHVRFSTQEMAARLGIAVQTAAKYRASVLRKLGARDESHLAEQIATFLAE